MKWSTCVVIALTCVATVTADATAQKDETIRIFHGRVGKTFAFAWNDNGRDDPNTRALEGRRLRRRVSAGDSVCFEVTNANKLFYDYSLVSRRDSTPTNLGITDIENFRSVILAAAELPIAKGVLAKTVMSFNAKSRELKASGNVAAVDTVTEAEWWTVFAAGISVLGEDVTDARSAVSKSDIPDMDIADATTRTAFEKAKEHVLSELPTAAGRFNDPKLDASVDKMYEAAKERLAALGTQSADAVILLEALRSHAQTLVKIRDSLKSALESTDGMYVGCHLVGDAQETLQLTISPREKQRTLSRSTGPRVVELSLVPTPAWIRVVPVLYSLPTGLRQEFELKDGRIALKDDGSTIRLTPGLFLGARVPAPFLEIEQISVRLGVGANVIATAGDELKGLFWGGFISFNDYLGIGAGFGDARTESLKEGVSAGGTLPAGQELTDVVTRSTKRGWFLLLSLRGINLANPLNGVVGSSKK